MHHRIILALALSLCTLPGCTACGAALSALSGHADSLSASHTASSASTASSVSAGSAVSQAAPQATAAARASVTDLRMDVEGTIEYVPATLHSGDGYSIYIPDGKLAAEDTGETEAFPVSGGTLPLNTLDRWASDDGMVTLSVSCEKGTAHSEIVRRLTKGGYQEQDDTRFLKWTDPDTNTVWVVYLPAGSDCVWLVAYSYPDTPEYAEGWGARLPAIAESFEAA